MPTLDISELNIIIAVLGGYTILYGLASVKIKQVWYLGEALPALLLGIILGPIAAKFIDSERWGSSVPGQTEEITLGITRVVIGVQLVMAGYQLPAKYPWHRWKDMAILLLPVMTIMWLCTTGCVKLMIPKLTTLTAMVIASLVTSTDPVLSQAIAKGPFADKYVPRALREIISAEAGSNDGFGFPFLLLATYLIRHTPESDVNFKPGYEGISKRSGDVGRLGGGVGKAIEVWVVEGWLYFILLGAVVGAVVGIASMFAVTFTLKRKWIDTESLLLYPTALGLFVIGVTGLAGLDDLLACFCAGAAMNWNGTYLQETLARHDEVNSSVDVLLNFGGFMYIGAILPWSEFNSEVTGITPARLIGLGILVLFLRRIPAMMFIYKAMPNTVKSWKEALFMGYFGPIGIGAVFYVEHARHLYPSLDHAETHEEENLLRAMGPVVYFLVLFSIVVHGLSIPALEIIYRWRGVQPVMELAPSMERRRSMSEALPPNSHVDPRFGSVVRHNRFSRAISQDGVDDLEDGCAWSGPRNMSMSRTVSMSRPLSRGTSWVSRPGSERAVSRGRQMPDAPPVWRLKDDGSEETTLKDEEEKQSQRDEEQKQRPRIQFIDETHPDRELRSPRLGNDVGSPATSFVGRDGLQRARSAGTRSLGARSRNEDRWD